MKRLFLFLLFINAVYFLWGTTVKQNKAHLQQQTPLYDAKVVETLALISEQQAALEITKSKAKQEVVDKVVQQVLAPSYSCYVLGDFATQTEADEFNSSLELEVNQSLVIPIRTVDEFWVMYPAAASWEESVQNEAMIKNKGESDLWLLPKGENKGVVSLGLFVDIERATSRLKELSEKQINAKIVVRSKRRYAVKIEVNDGAAFLETFSQQLELANESSISKISC
ncbi:MAG: hypothetical protein QNK15_09075 [Cycloclasticus sp.]|nr:hypothetical protein [Cycloclasticus sp.]